MHEVVFAVLGPVEASVDGRVVALGGGRRRALLVRLLLSADQVVSVDRLVDELWGDLPPASARTQVHTLVHRVRRALGEAGALIETRPPGYVLRLGSARLDLAVFTDLVEDARKEAGAGRLESAAGTFREALGLWRGRPLDGIDAAFASREAARLEETHLTALEECLGLELALGRHAAVVAELSALVAEHPLREDLRARLMLALYRCGRQSEALEVYREGRALLVEETGLEPTVGLRALHEAILQGDTALRHPEPKPPTPMRPDAEEPGSALSETESFPDVPKVPARAGVRSLRARGAILVLALAMLPGLGGGAAGADLSRPYSSGTDGTPLVQGRQRIGGPTWVNSPPIGVPAAFFGTTVGSGSGAMPGFRVGTVRFWDSGTRWSNVQPRRDAFDWSALDRMVAGARRARLPMTYTMGITPAWAAPGGPRSAYSDGSRTAPPDDLADWDRYVRAVVSRYRGQIEAYELWDFPNTPYHYTGDVATLVELTRRAAAIIKAVDARATVVCPSFGEMWKPEGLQYLIRFGTLGGFRSCDAIAVKLHPRLGDGRPEEMTEQAVPIYNALHQVGVHLPMWATGPAHDIPTVEPLGEEDANNYAVRHYLAGLYARYSRMYFYSWGPRNLPLVLQAEGGPPTRAALFVQRLQQWLDGARIRSCGKGPADGLPEGAWQCRFLLPGSAEAAVRWMADGTAEMKTEPGAHRVEHLDGRTVPVRGGQAMRLTETPVLIRFRAS
ncbi:BTAD domain-containing putative transcriptional regulator [Actinomadura sp. KC06]|uniref:BTAD domain-containing putative transcriptional regulator n=1 Tax=Actinomadura sp. KC06 TaxID=2530369 RepID=UPI001404469C|nr:BTAD domain-containing putative transcriptional regulator [Actinomadura sp. KC06]